MRLHLSRKELLSHLSRSSFATPGAIRFLWMVAVAVSMVSCSKDVFNEPQVNLTRSEVVVNNNSAELSKRVTLYGKRATLTRAGTRSGSGITMPPAPEKVPEGAIPMTDNFVADNPESGENYYLPSGQEKSVNLNLNNCTYYICGTLTINGYWNPGKLIVMPGGKVIYKLDKTNSGGISIWNYGGFEIECNSSSFEIGQSDSFMTSGDLELDRSLKFGGTVYVGGNLDCNGVSPYGNGVLQVGGVLNVGGDVNVTNTTKLYANGGIVANNIELNSGGEVYYGCELIAREKLYITNSTTVHVDSYVNSPLIEMNSSAKLEIKAGGLVRTDKLTISNAESCKIDVVKGTEDDETEDDETEFAMIWADRIEANSEVRNTFTGWIDIHCDEFYCGNAKKTFDEMGFISNISNNKITYLPAKGCSPGFGTKPEDGGTDPGPSVYIDHIAKVESPDHSHYISATCIQTVNDKAYVSWHTQGEGFHGCVEVLQVPSDGSNCTIRSFMEHETLDFNHVMFDGNRIIACGDDPKKGAFLGIVGLTDGFFDTSNTELQQVILSEGGFKAGSTNCVIRNGDYLYVTTNAGYCTLDATTFERTACVPTTGSSKFVHQSGTNIGILSLTQRDVNESPAEMTMYYSTDYDLSNPWRTFNVGNISPINGKNVAQVDGNNVYVCLGVNGVKRFDMNGTEQDSFKVTDPKQQNAAANGMAVDSRYVYVAYGGAGLFVLNKETLTEVASYHYTDGASANYVSVSGDILYVAYGLSGVQVFKLVER